MILSSDRLGNLFTGDILICTFIECGSYLPRLHIALPIRFMTTAAQAGVITNLPALVGIRRAALHTLCHRISKTPHP